MITIGAAVTVAMTRAEVAETVGKPVEAILGYGNGYVRLDETPAPLPIMPEVEYGPTPDAVAVEQEVEAAAPKPKRKAPAKAAAKE